MEFGSRHNAEASKNIEGTNEYADRPFDKKAAIESVKEMKRLIDSLPADDWFEELNETAKKEAAKKEARDEVLASFHKTESPTRVRDIDQPKDIEGREFRFTGNQSPNEEVETEPTEVAPTETPTEPEPTEPEKQPKNIDDNVFKALFSTPTNIKNMLGDQQFSRWQNIINQDINDGKYADAKYEDGLMFHIGKVNEGSVDERGDEWDTMKYRSQDERLKYNEQIKNIDPKVWNQINKTVYSLGATLGDNSKEYHDALNKINQDIYDGRYQNAEYVVMRNEGEEFEEGVIVFNEVTEENKIKEESGQNEVASAPEVVSGPEVVSEPEITEPEDRLTPDASQTKEPEPIPNSKEESFKGEMTGIINFEARKSVDMLKKVYARLNNADTEQKDRFRYLYQSLSATCKMKPLNKEEEQKKMDYIFAYKNLINKLYDELGGE